MEIRFRDIDDTADLAQLYNDQIIDDSLGRVPFCFPVSTEEFVEGLRLDRDGNPLDTRLRYRKILVAEENGRPLAFADVALSQLKEDGRTEETGVIRFMTYPPGSRPVGQALLEAAEKYLLDWGVDRIRAFLKTFSYRFYHLGFGMLSDRQGHVHGLLGINGYEQHGGEIFMAGPIPDLREPALPEEGVDNSVEEIPGRGSLPNLTVRALRDGREVGACYSHSAGEYVHCQEAQMTSFTVGLGIEDLDQGRGWGLYLLHHSLWEMRKIGYELATISTDWRNYRALLLYTNYGYHAIDTVYRWGKDC